MRERKETMLRAIRWPIRQGDVPPKIDFGGGFFVPAEDVLDGHLKRLLSEDARSVKVQTGPTLHSTIAVSSPELTPLTDLAEDLAEVVPDVAPEPNFRQDLHRALELTHRQHAAQRALGTSDYNTDDEFCNNRRPMLIGLALLLAASLVLLLWGRATRRK